MNLRTVRPATEADVPELTDVLARAFNDRPPFTWIQPDDARRSAVLHALFKGSLRHIYPVEHGTEVLAENGAILGGAVWAPPGGWKAPLLRQLRAIPGMVRAMGMKNLPDFAKRGKAIEEALHRAHPSEPHWYLAALGVDPRAHGQGAGKTLLSSGLARCDREGTHAYLECIESLVPYYRRFGFEPIGRIELPEGASDQMSMWRARRSIPAGG